MTRTLTGLVTLIIAVHFSSPAAAFSCRHPPTENESYLDFIVSTSTSKHDELFVGHLTEPDKGPFEQRPEFLWIMKQFNEQVEMHLSGDSSFYIDNSYLFTGTILTTDGRIEATDASVTIRIDCFLDGDTAFCDEPFPVGQNILLFGHAWSNGTSASFSPNACYPYFDLDRVLEQYSLKQLESAFLARSTK